MKCTSLSSKTGGLPYRARSREDIGKIDRLRIILDDEIGEQYKSIDIYLHDQLMIGSRKTTEMTCSNCGNFLNTMQGSLLETLLYVPVS